MAKETAIQIDSEYADRIAPRLKDEVLQSASDAEPYLAVIERNRALLKDEQPRVNPPWEGASELLVPYIKQAKLALMSHFSPILLGPDPVLHIEGTSPNSKETSDEVENYLQAQLTRTCGFIPTMRRGFDAALRDSTAIIHTYWDTARIWCMGPRGEEHRLVYDAPKFDLIEISYNGRARFGTFPAVNAHIQDSPGVFVRYPMTGHAIKQRAGYFDKGAVEQLLQLSPPEDTVATADNTRKGITTSQPVAGDDTLGKSYEITQIYYREAFGTDKVRDWLIFLYEPNGIILRCAPSPWFHGRRPFDAFTPYEGSSGYFGDSLATAGGGQTQLALTTLLRLGIDAASLGIMPEMLVTADSKLLADIKKRRGPAGVIPVPPNFFEGQKIQPFATGGYNPQVIFPLAELVTRMGGESLGVNDAMKGVPNPGNVTATEAEQIIEGSQKITAYLTENLAESLSRIGQTAVELNQQYVGNDGPKALWAEVNAGRDVTLKQAMAGSYRVTASGVRDTQNKGVLAKRAMERVGLLMQVPQVAQAPDRLYALLYDTLQATGTQDPTRYLGTAEEWAPPSAPDGAPMAPAAPAGALPPAMGAMPMQEGIPPEAAQYPPELLALAQALGDSPDNLAAYIMQQAEQLQVSPDEVLQQMIADAQQEAVSGQ